MISESHGNVSWWKMHPNFPDAARILGHDRIKYFVESTEYRQLHDFAGGLVEFAWRRYVGRTRIQLLKYRQDTLAEDDVTPSEFKGRIILKCTRLELVAKSKMKTCADKMRYRWRRMLKTSNLDVGHSSAVERKKNGTAA